MKGNVLANCVVVTLAGFLSACGGGNGGGSSPTPTITSVSVSCSPNSISTAQTSLCTATVLGTGAYSTGVNWTAKGGTITSGGVFTPSGAGTATITATSTQDATKSGTATVTVNAVAVNPPTAAIAANPTTITLGQSTTISGACTNSTSATASGAWSGSVALNSGGNFSVAETPSAAGSPVYTVTCTGAGGSANASVTVTVNAPPTASIGAKPGVITLGESTTISGACTNSTSATASGAWSGSVALNSSGNFSVAETPPAAGSPVYTVTCTGAGGSANASVTVTVNAPVTVQSVSGSCLPATITTDPSSTSQCSGTVTYSDGSHDGNVTYATSLGAITSSGVLSSTTVGTATVTFTAVKDTTKSATTQVTVTVAMITIGSVTPGTQWCLGQCGFPTFTVNGTNFPSPYVDIVCTPTTKIASYNIVNSTQLTVQLAIDQTDEGAGYRSCQVCQSNGTGCSNAVPLGLYSHNMCGTYASGTTTKVFCLNPQETVAGQHLYNGQLLNGYIDQFTAAGVAVPNGKIFVGAPVNQMAVDDLTGIIVVDGVDYDQNGNNLGGPSNLPSRIFTGIALKHGWQCVIQANTTNDLSCSNISTLTAGNPAPPYTSIAVGTNPQSVAIGVVGGKTYAYVLTAGSTTTVWSVDLTDGMTITGSQTLTGVTAGLPAGSDIALFDSLGIGVIISYGDAVAIPFSETTLKPTAANPIALPGTPVSILAGPTVAIIGNADTAGNDGTFTTLDPVAGTATAVNNETAPVMPVGTAVSGSNLLVCPQDGVSNCTALPSP